MKKSLFILFASICMMFLSGCDYEEFNMKNAWKEAEEIEDETESHVNEVIMYEKNNILIKLFASENIEDGKIFLFDVKNDNAKNYTVSISDCVINNKINISDMREVISVDGGKSQRSKVENLQSQLFYSGEDSVNSLQCHVIISNKLWEKVDESDVSVEIPQGLKPSFCFLPTMGARAEKQILLENEEVKIELLGFGDDLSSYDNEHVSAYLSCENVSDEDVCINIEGISLNGMYFSAYESCVLQPGKECIIKCDVLNSDIEEMEIDAISDVSVLMLVEQGSESKTYSDGGIWYPIELAEKGPETFEFQTGELLDEIEGVEISLISQEHDIYDEGGSYEWKLAIINNMNENIEVSIENIYLNGIPYEEIEDEYFIYEGDKVGACSKCYGDIRMSYDNELVNSELKFIFRIKSMGGEYIIAEGTKEIVLTTDNLQ